MVLIWNLLIRLCQELDREAWNGCKYRSLLFMYIV
jgi:hypothetical protein